MWVPCDLAGSINCGINIPQDPFFRRSIVAISFGWPLADTVAGIHGDLSGSTRTAS